MTFLAVTASAEAPALAIKKSSNSNAVIATFSGDFGKDDVIILTSYTGLNDPIDTFQIKSLSKAKFLTTAFKSDHVYKAMAVNMKTMKPLCETVSYSEGTYRGSVEVPYVDGAVAEATTAAIREYTEAKLKVDELLALDLDAVEGNAEKLAEYEALVEDAQAAYDDAMKAAAVLYSVSDEYVTENSAKLTSMEEAKLMATDAEQQHWAEQITKLYDSIKGTWKLKQFAAMLGCDVKEAKALLDASQDILRGKYLKDAKAADNWVKGLTVIKTGCKVGLVVGATIATYGAGGATLTGATGLWLGTADAVVDVGRTTAVIAYGDDSKEVAHYEKVFAPVTTTATIFSILTFSGASAGEKIACLGDINEWAREKFGFSSEELSFKLSGGKLMMDIFQKGMTKDNFQKLLNDPAFIGNDKYERLLDAKSLFDEGRDIISMDKLAEILDEGNVIEKGSEKDEYDELFDSFEEVATEELDQKRAEEAGDGITYCVEGGTHGKKYFQNANGDYVGRYEIYYEGVLTDVYMYDDNGTLLWRTNYDYKSGTTKHPGRKTCYTSYTNGRNWDEGSVETSVHYYFEDSDIAKLPPGVTEQVKYIEMHNGNGLYYGDHYRFDYDGNMREHSWGSGNTWLVTEEYAQNGLLSMREEANADGTITRRDYFTECPEYWTNFDPTGDLQHTLTYGYENNQYFETDEQKWRLYKWEESMYEDGKYVGYEEVFGYRHSYDMHLHTGEHYEYIESPKATRIPHYSE